MRLLLSLRGKLYNQRYAAYAACAACKGSWWLCACIGSFDLHRNQCFLRLAFLSSFLLRMRLWRRQSLARLSLLLRCHHFSKFLLFSSSLLLLAVLRRWCRRRPRHPLFRFLFFTT